MKAAMITGHRSGDLVHNDDKTLVMKVEAEKLRALKPSEDR